LRRKSKLNFLDPRISVVTLIFTFIGGIRNGFQPYLYIILLDYGIIETGLVASIIGALFFLINPVLFCITLFFICERNLLMRIAGTVVSLITGSLMGYWSDGLIGAYYLYVAVYGESFAGVMLNLAYQIPYSVASTASVGFAIVALAWITTKWNEALDGLQVPFEKPSCVLWFSYINPCGWNLPANYRIRLVKWEEVGLGTGIYVRAKRHNDFRKPDCIIRALRALPDNS
jgi:hypothetical protein